MWIDIDNSKFNTDLIACIRPVDDGDEQCVLFTAGQDAAGSGFLIDLPLDEVFEKIQMARLHELAEMIEVPDAEPDSSPPEPVDGQE
jgi:hypothetical protein